MKKGRMRPPSRTKTGAESGANPYENNDTRHRNHSHNNHSNNGNRVNYQQMYDKYIAHAKDALSNGDRVAAEYNYQCADHYLRMVKERQNYFNEQKKLRPPREETASQENQEAPGPEEIRIETPPVAVAATISAAPSAPSVKERKAAKAIIEEITGAE